MCIINVCATHVIQYPTSEWDSQLKWDNPNHFLYEVTGVIFDSSSVV